MSEWEEVKLGSIIEIIGGGTPKTSISEYWNGEIPWLSVVDFNHGRKWVKSTEKSITEMGLKNSSTKLLDKGDIIISARGTVGALAVLDKKMAFKQSCYGIHGKEDISETDYIFYLLKNTIKELSQISHGGVFDTITRNTFDEINIELPPLPEQQAIASVLSSLDDKIDLLHRQNKTLEAMVETLFRQWFIEEAKEDWKEVEVKNYAILNQSTLNKDYPHSQISYLDTGSLTKGLIQELQTFNLNDAPSRAKRLVKSNDILISTVRPNQCHYGIINNPIENLVVSTGFCTVTANNISPYFLYFLLTSNDMTEYLHSVAEGSTSTYPSLKPSDIGAVKFNLPPSEKLENFDSIASSNWAKIHANHKQIQTLENLRNTLLPKLMSGEIRVQH